MTQPHSIGITIDSLLPGGAERMAIELATALDPARYRPRVLVTRCSGPLQPLLDTAGVEYCILDRQGRLDRRAFRRALEFLDGVELIHAHKFSNNVYSAGLARRLGIPLIPHEHNWSQGSGGIRRMVDRFLLGRMAARYVACGYSVAATLTGNGVAPDRIVVLPNATAPVQTLARNTARAQLGLADDAIVVGMLARLRPEKGADVLIESMGMLPVRPGAPVIACILGDGPEAAALVAQAEALGVSNDVVFAGHRDNARELISAFDIAAIPSRWEGLPLAALELMLGGVPVVASAVGELPELLDDGRGRTIEPASAPRLAAAIAELADNPTLRASIGAAAAAHVREHHMLDAIAAQAASLYDAVLAEAGHPALPAGKTVEDAA